MVFFHQESKIFKVRLTDKYFSSLPYPPLPYIYAIMQLIIFSGHCWSWTRLIPQIGPSLLSVRIFLPMSKKLFNKEQIARMRGGEWSFKKFGSRKILVEFQGSCSLVFWADFEILEVWIFLHICLEVWQRKTLLLPSRKVLNLPLTTPCMGSSYGNSLWYVEYHAKMIKMYCLYLTQVWRCCSLELERIQPTATRCEQVCWVLSYGWSKAKVCKMNAPIHFK